MADMAGRRAANLAMAADHRGGDRGDRRRILLACARQWLGRVAGPRDRSRRDLAGRAGSTFAQERMTEERSARNFIVPDASDRSRPVTPARGRYLARDPASGSSHGILV